MFFFNRQIVAERLEDNCVYFENMNRIFEKGVTFHVILEFLKKGQNLRTKIQVSNFNLYYSKQLSN